MKPKNSTNVSFFTTNILNMDEYGFGEDKEMIDYILNHLSKGNKQGITADKIEAVIDYMLDFYDSKGFLDDTKNEDEDVEIDETEMCNFILEKLDKAKITLTTEQLDEILDLEYQYNLDGGVYN